jgi:hypothetical protein
MSNTTTNDKVPQNLGCEANSRSFDSQRGSAEQDCQASGKIEQRYQATCASARRGLPRSYLPVAFGWPCRDAPYLGRTANDGNGRTCLPARPGLLMPMSCAWAPWRESCAWREAGKASSMAHCFVLLTDPSRSVACQGPLDGICIEPSPVCMLPRQSKRWRGLHVRWRLVTARSVVSPERIRSAPSVSQP